MLSNLEILLDEGNSNMAVEVASLYSLLYFLEFDWLRPTVLFFLKQESLPIISKGKSDLKLSKLIPNWTVC